MKTHANLLEDTTFKIGLGIFAIALIFFGITQHLALRGAEDFMMPFFGIYALFICYLFVVGASNKQHYGGWFRHRNKRWSTMLLLIFNLSAYGLNRAIPVFHESVDWLTGFLMTLNAAILLYCFRPKHIPDGLNYGLVFFLSFGVLFNIYEVIYVYEFYLVGVLGFWVFGIPVHIFVPLMWLSLLIPILREYVRTSSTYWQPIIAAWVIPMVIIAWFTVEWSAVNQEINYEPINFNSKEILGKDTPDWVNLSRRLPANWVTKKALKSELFYTVAGDNGMDGAFNNMNRVNGRIQHDPLVVIASLLAGEIELDQEEKVKIYNALYNERHQTENRLWSGDNLATDHIETTVQIFPEHRIAYTEKVVDIVHKGKATNRWTGVTQEALYSFYLPEGSVVTSASLWVEGEERPAYLTTKSKADSAYTTIVGRERRDPLLIHWQEGNRVSLRVFPVSPDLPRKFKIGVTTPLQKEGKELRYQNLDFQGPEWLSATENVTVLNTGTIENMDAPWGLYATDNGWEYEGTYLSDWDLTFTAPPLATDAFSFNGKTLNLSEYQAQFTDFQPDVVYFDINDSWSFSEFEELYAAFPNSKKCVYDNEIYLLKDDNKRRWFDRLAEQNFSLFPLYKIGDTNTALVLTKSGQITPTLRDLKSSIFAEKLNETLATQAPVRVFHIGQELSPYWKSLTEVDAIQLQRGTFDEVLYHIDKQQFIVNQENDNTVVLANSGIKITNNSGTTTSSTVPDHLLRLFAYNDLMQAVGQNYFSEKYLEKTLIQQAEEANIVTPVSSLIVLETQEDYDRFDIKKSNNSLDNAAIQNSGAVPEPAEWLLIILVLGVMTFLVLKRRGKYIVE